MDLWLGRASVSWQESRAIVPSEVPLRNLREADLGSPNFQMGSKLGTMGCTQQIIPALYQFQYPVHTWLIPAQKTILDPSTSNQAGIKVLNQTQNQVDIRV